MDAYPGDLILHLRSFLALLTHVRHGRRGAFEHAARDLGVDRSVLRRRLQTLGTWLGREVLEGRGVDLRPTATGERLAERAARIVADAAQLREDVANARERLVVGCTGTITTELLPSVIVALEKRSPPVQVLVRRASGANCERLVRRGDLDIGVVRADDAPRGLASEWLADDRLWFVLPREHPLASRPKLTLRQMASVPLVLFGESSRTRARVMEPLGRLGGAIRVEVDGRAAALAYVRAGIGATCLSLLPGHAVDVRGVRAYDVTALFAPSRFFVIGRRERWSSGSVVDAVRLLGRAARAGGLARTEGGAPRP